MSRQRSWIMAHDGTLTPLREPMFECQRCGATKAVARQITAADYIKAAQDFTAIHVKCPPVDPCVPGAPSRSTPVVGEGA